MIIFHCADLHLDSKMETNLSPEKALIRQNELIDTFLQMVKIANEKKVKVILIAGDLFDTKKAKQKSIKKHVIYIISQNPQIDFLYLRGNHDDEDYFSENILQPSNLKFFSKDSWTTYDYEDVAITARELLPSNNIDSAVKTDGSILDSVYSELVLSKSKINIVSLHGFVSKSLTKMDAPFINLSKLANKNIDYLALGHIHSFMHDKLDSRGTWCYSGCLEGRGFDETGDKGFVQLEIIDNKIQRSFISIAKRKLILQEIDITGLVDFSEILNEIKKQIQNIDSENLVKIVLTGEVSEDADVDIDLFSAQLLDYFFFLKIEDKTERKINYQKYQNEISLKGEFVRTVESQNIDEQEKAKIIIVGLKALADKEF